MKEYKILREIENPRMGPNNRQLLEADINTLAKQGWVVHEEYAFPPVYESLSGRASWTGPSTTLGGKPP